MKNWNLKTKGEQMFLLCIMFICAFGLLCITGCGGNSCECVKCADENAEGVEVKGISIPGCGGCMTSGKGCDSCLWAQSCKYISVHSETENDEEENGEKETDVMGCDVKYYGGGCLGCGQSERSSYVMYMDFKGDTEENTGKIIVYGNSENMEKTIMCGGGGCVKCTNSAIGEYTLKDIEKMLGVD